MGHLFEASKWGRSVAKPFLENDECKKVVIVRVILKNVQKQAKNPSRRNEKSFQSPRIAKVRLDQARLEDDVVGGDSADAELFKGLLPVKDGEEFVWGLVAEHGAGVAVDVGEHLVDLLLVEVVEGLPLGPDKAQKLVVALYVSLLPGGARVAVEDV